MDMRRNTWNKDIKGRPLYEGDRILFNVQRVSEGGSSHGQFTSKKDGWYRIPGIIEFQNGRFIVKGEKAVIEELKKAVGKESFNRGVWSETQDLHDVYYGNVQKITEKGTIAPISLGTKWPKKEQPSRVARVKSRYEILKEEMK